MIEEKYQLMSKEKVIMGVKKLKGSRKIFWLEEKLQQK